MPKNYDWNGVSFAHRTPPPTMREPQGETKIKGVYNFNAGTFTAPVLKCEQFDNFHVEKTCISVTGEPLEFDTKKFIGQVMNAVATEFAHCKANNKNFGEHCLFDSLAKGVEGFWLNAYTFDETENNEIYLIVWYEPIKVKKRRHIFWYGKECDNDWW